MITCPVCDADIDVDNDELDEGDTITCDECGSDLKVLSVEPTLEVEPMEEEEEDDEELDLDEDDEEEENWK